jgi:D-alanyl-D-alanine carboxypeptidase/D-alanyl-D-alanine-endopeptidase (penicillin-binding protein 4)
MVGLGKTAPGARSRVKNPARQAATLFSQGLKAQGVQVGSVSKGVTPSTATELARHESLHLTALVGDLLADSDNDLAESLAHLVGGKVVGDASFEGGAQATTSILKSAGISTVGMMLADGSGLSRSNAISADTLADLLSVVALGKESSWWPISAGLAIAGSTGTLADRFSTKSTKAGAGVVRAKTGSLTGVSSLAGLVRDDDGRLLVFALISNKVSSLYSARETMDKIASRLAECGCTS